MPTVPYNPLDKVNLAKSIENELMQRTVKKLGSTELITGAGPSYFFFRGAFRIVFPNLAAAWPALSASRRTERRILPSL